MSTRSSPLTVALVSVPTGPAGRKTGIASSRRGGKSRWPWRRRWPVRFVDFVFRSPILGPVFFQSVVAAVIPFEIAFFSLWYLSSRRFKGQPLTGKGVTRPGAPAIVMIVMIVVISALAIAAIFSRRLRRAWTGIG